MNTMADEALEAGRDLDAQVAVKLYELTTRVYRGLFGETLYIVDDTAERTSATGTSARLISGVWTKGYDESGALVEFYGYICPAYSSNIADAWRVVERLEGIYDYDWTLANKVGGYAFRIYNDVDYNGFIGRGETVPLAICRAALLAFADR